MEELYSLFEQYAKDPSAYTDFDALVEDMVRKLKGVEPTVEA